MAVWRPIHATAVTMPYLPMHFLQYGKCPGPRLSWCHFSIARRRQRAGFTGFAVASSSCAQAVPCRMLCRGQRAPSAARIVTYRAAHCDTCVCVLVSVAADCWPLALQGLAAGGHTVILLGRGRAKSPYASSKATALSLGVLDAPYGTYVEGAHALVPALSSD